MPVPSNPQSAKYGAFFTPTQMQILIAIAIGLGSLYLLWLFYLAVMCLKRAYDAGTISKPALYLGYPILFLGLLIDLLVNVFVASVLLLEMPQELTVTARLGRLIRTDNGWRRRAALWFCSQLLDTFDPSGLHCR